MSILGKKNPGGIIRRVHQNVRFSGILAHFPPQNIGRCGAIDPTNHRVKQF
jgi:hypothetical protein